MNVVTGDSHLDLLWIIPLSLGLTWLGYRLLHAGYEILQALLDWLLSPAGQRAIERLITRAVVTVMLGMGAVVVLRVLVEASR